MTELDPELYTVAWFAPLEIEAQAALHMLDNKHRGRFPVGRGDDYVFQAGDMCGHNVIIATLPAGQEYGTGSAAALSSQVKRFFPNLWFGLLVGVAAGLPNFSRCPPLDIRLGDVLVGLPTNESAGLIAYGLGKETGHHGFQLLRFGHVLANTETVVRSAIGSIKLSAPNDARVISPYYQSIKHKRHSNGTFADPGQERDVLYEADSDGNERLVERERRPDDERTRVWYGTIGSGDKLMKNAQKRNELRDKYDVIGLEMEAAGTMNHVPVGVIRGVCDYGDEHKNKEWQPYAAAIAAAYAKAVLSEILPRTTPVAPRTTAKEDKGKKRKRDEGHPASIADGRHKNESPDKEDDAVHHLSKLPNAVDAAFNSRCRENEPHCLTGTRVDILQQIIEWGTNDRDKCVFWLNGMAGSGKSTIARTAARMFYDDDRLGASFFFSRGRGDLAKADKLFPTIALQLARVSNHLKRYICEAVSENEDICQQVLRDQWKRLIFRPLSMLKEGQIRRSPLVLVFDALDECENQNDVRMILRFFADLNQLEALQVRVLVTGRPETPIPRGFGGISDNYRELVLHKNAPFTTQSDISAFINHELEDVKYQHSLPADWPGEPAITTLTQRAGVLFIYASTVCRFIGDSKFPDLRLNQVIEEGVISSLPQRNSFTSVLDDMYGQVLTQAALDCNEEEMIEWAKLFRQVVGCIVILNDTLSLKALAELLSLSASTLISVLSPLRSVLEVPTDGNSSVRVLHPSFQEFLLDEQRCSNEHFRINKGEVHTALVKNSIEVMSKTLERDVCHLKMPGAPSNGFDKPAHVRYAICFWVHHLRWAETDLSSDNGDVHLFLQTHFLHWLEALSIMGEIPKGILMITSLLSMLPPDKPTNLRNLVHDARRFMLIHRRTIEVAPLQVYTSALLFSPEKSIIRSLFWKAERSWAITYPVVEDWGPALQTLEGHSDWVRSLALSSDGRSLASGSDDETVRIWDPATGTLLQKLEGHSKGARAVDFSPDGRLLACGSGDGVVRLWDPITGDVTYKLESDSGSIRQLAFSPSGELLACGSGDGPIRLWNPTTGDCTVSLEGHSGSVWALAFSPNGRCLASGSDDGTVRLWDPIQGENLHQLEGHLGSVRTVVFSPDGFYLASGSGDGTVRVWNTATGAAVHILKGHSRSVRTLVFSPNGRILASGSGDRTVCLWDPATGDTIHRLEVHSGSVQTLLFSPDGRILAGGLGDGTIRLWEPTKGTALQTLQGHLSWVEGLAFSPDGRVLASGSGDRTVRLWDIDSVELHRPSNTDHGQAPSSPSLCSIDNSKRWVTWNTHSVLLLPADRECVEFVAADNVMAIGHSTGRITFLKINPDINPFTPRG